MRPELLICDIDGTVVSKGTMILPETKKAIQSFVDQGVLFALASGRPITRKNINKTREWGFDFDPAFIIGNNGNEIWYNDEKTIHRSDLLRKELVREILSFMWPLDVNAVVFEDGYDLVLCRRYDDWCVGSKARNDINFLVCDFDRLCARDVGKLEFHYNRNIETDVIKTIEKHPSNKWDYVSTFPGTMEFQKKGVNKGKALIEACNRYGISLENVIACGDMDNDIPMLEAAGISICLKNGSDRTKQASDYITEEDVENDGLGKFLLNRFL